MKRAIPEPVFDDAVDQQRDRAGLLLKREAELVQQREQRRAENRARMPKVAAAFDLCERLFGPGCAIIYAREAGHEVGKSVWRDENEANYGSVPMSDVQQPD